MSLLADTAASLLGHPLAQRWSRKINASGNNRVYTPDDVLGERILRMGELLYIEDKLPGRILLPGAKIKREDALLLLVGLVLKARPYLWSEEVRSSLRDITVPRLTLSPTVLTDPRAWHTFETGITTGGVFEHEGKRFEDGTADALLVSDAGKGLTVSLFGEMRDADTGDPYPAVFTTGHDYGTVYPDDLNDAERVHLESVLVANSFLNSPYIPKERRKLSRGARREAARAGVPSEDEDVTFIILRRPAPRRREDSEETTVAWRHRWLVNGHVRAQWYPSEQAHKPIWIAPYLKGPEDAPMLEHAYKVAR